MESSAKTCRQIPHRAAALGIAAAIAVALTTFTAGAQQTTDHSLQQARLPVGMSTHTASKFQFEFAPAARWMTPMRWKYNHANAPAELAASKGAVIAQLQATFDKWTSQCGAAYQYEGETITSPNTLVPSAANGNEPDGTSVVGWGSLELTYGAWTYVWYAMAGTQRVLIDADITLSVNNVRTLGDVDRLMTHEWGHALGLAHSNIETAVMAGPPMAGYSPLVTPQADDVRGCRCLYGLPPGLRASYVCSLPPVVDFGSASVGMTPAPQNVTFTNSGNAPLSIQTAEVGDQTQFARVNGCGPGTVVGPAESCTVTLTATPANIGIARSQLVMFTSEGYYELPLVTVGANPGAALSNMPTVDVIEYYNATLDHYFITWTAAEIVNLDAGLTSPRWLRTGKSFKAFTPAQNGAGQVCRFYIPPALGDSHFFGRGDVECNATRMAHPDFVLEEPNYAQLFVPTGGACPAGSTPIYRVFNNRPETNHRYMIERAIRDAMVAKGWVAEGDGVDMVAMCGP